MQESIKSRYGNEILDRIFRYFMRTALHLQNSGIEDLPLENDFEDADIPAWKTGITDKDKMGRMVLTKQDSFTLATETIRTKQGMFRITCPPKSGIVIKSLE